jgi:hypothetical protein
VAEWLKAAVLKGDPPLSHSVPLSPSLPRSVCTQRAPLSGSVRLSPVPVAPSPHKIPHTSPWRLVGELQLAGLDVKRLAVHVEPEIPVQGALPLGVALQHTRLLRGQCPCRRQARSGRGHAASLARSQAALYIS